MKQDLREYKRIPADIKIMVKEPDLSSERGNDFLASICNISEGGVYISQPQFVVFSIINFKIQAANGENPIFASGIVQFNDGSGIGVKFIKIDRDASDRLKRLICEHSCQVQN